MLTIKTLNKTTFLLLMAFCSLLMCCTGKAPAENKTQEAVEIDSTTAFYEQPEDKTVYDYRSFQGIYDHESTTRGFSAVLTLTESGNDLDFTISVLQGSCKGEAKGKLSIVSHEENSHVGFFELDECPLQFSLMLQQDKIDVKEVALCRLHEGSCTFEGTYAKRKR